MIGIYAIVNKINNKVYIGQSWDIEERWEKHIRNLKNKKRNKGHLYTSILKYGLENFNFLIIKEMSSDITQNELDFYENIFINFYNTINKNFGYNKRGAGSRGRHTEESKEKNRQAHLGKSVNKGIPKTEEAKKNMSLSHPDTSGEKNPMWGKKHSLETKSKQSEKAKKRTGTKNPFYGKQHTEEFCLKMKAKFNAYQESLGFKVFCYNNNKTYPSLRKAAEDLNIPEIAMSFIYKGKIKEYDGYTFSFEGKMIQRGGRQKKI